MHLAGRPVPPTHKLPSAFAFHNPYFHTEDTDYVSGLNDTEIRNPGYCKRPAADEFIFSVRLFRSLSCVFSLSPDGSSVIKICMPPLHTAGLLLTVFITPFFLFRKPREIHDIMASLLLLSFAAFLSAPFLLHTNLPALMLIPPAIPFITAPLFYFYIMSFFKKSSQNASLLPGQQMHSESRTSGSFSVLIHFIPAAAVYLFFLLFVPEIPGASPMMHSKSSGIPLYLLSLGPLTVMHLTGYAGASWFFIERSVKQYESSFSDPYRILISTRLRILTAGFIIAVILLISLELNFELLSGIIDFRQTIHPIIIIFFIIIFWYVNLQSGSLPDPEETAGKIYEKSSVSDEKINEYKSLIQEYFRKEKPYLNERFSVLDLEKGTGIPRHHLSQVFSRGWNTNFYNFTNKYRILEALDCLKNPELADYPLLRIAFECGFNSKASFNRVFRKITGKTPSEIRNILKNQNENGIRFIPDETDFL